MKTYGSVQATVDAYFEGKESGKNKQGNAWFEKGVFYSYNTPIYQIRKIESGILVFINTRKYSITTTKLKAKLDGMLWRTYKESGIKVTRLHFTTAENSWTENYFSLKNLSSVAIGLLGREDTTYSFI